MLDLSFHNQTRNYKLQIRLQELDDAKRLYTLQKPYHDGCGVICVRRIVTQILLGNVGTARDITRRNWGGIAYYPDVAKWLKEAGFAKKDWYINDF